jgi:hypothetical protein
VQGMKGYFSSIASRSVGRTTPKAVLKPQRSGHWPGAQGRGEDALTVGDHLPMNEWPDSFDGNPVNLPPSGMEGKNRVQIASQGPLQPIVPQQETPGQVVLPDVPSLQHEPKVGEGVVNTSKPQQLAPVEETKVTMEPPTNLQPPVKQQFPVPPAEQAATHVQQSITNPKAQPEVIPPQVQPPQAEIPKEHPLKPQQRIPFSRVMHEIKTTEGLMEEAPRTQPQAKVRDLTPKAEEKPTLTPQPEVPVERPTAKAQPLSPEKSMGLPISPPKNPTTVPLTPPQQQQATWNTKANPASGLVIGKITVEVVDAPQPNVVTQSQAAPAARNGNSRRPVSRKESTLKYGLGQI